MVKKIPHSKSIFPGIIRFTFMVQRIYIQKKNVLALCIELTSTIYTQWHCGVLIWPFISHDNMQKAQYTKETKD